MKIWSDTLNQSDLAKAARLANVDIISDISPFNVHKARKRAYRFEIVLSGDSPFRNGHDSSYPAATWDQWGIFLNALFEIDPDISTQYYANREAFNAITDDRFIALTYEQSHRRHNWRYMPIGRVLHYSCNGCTAEQWPRDRKNQPMLAPTAPALI